MEAPAASRSWLAEAWAWLSWGQRRLYAAGVVSLLVVLAVLSFVPSGEAVSPGRMEELVNTAYSTTGTHCAKASHGRDLCRLKAERCRGTLLVAPSSNGHFTIVSSTPDQLDSSACVKSEGSVAGFE
jgi:hypothetical protein